MFHLPDDFIEINRSIESDFGGGANTLLSNFCATFAFFKHQQNFLCYFVMSKYILFILYVTYNQKYAE